MSNEIDYTLSAPDFAIPPEHRTYLNCTYHLPICVDCDELCFTPGLTRTEYDAWRERHKAMGHTLGYGPEIP